MLLIKHPEVDKLVRKLSDNIIEALDDNLNGLYLFGSLVSGGFDSKTSDIDLLAITKNTISDSELELLRTMHDKFVEQHTSWNDRIEVAYVSQDAMKDFKTKTSQIARVSPGEPLHFRNMDIEWLLDWYMVQEQGLTITGASPKEYIPTITADEFITNIRNRLPTWVEAAKDAKHVGYQSYIILSLCRSLYAIKFGKQTSKPTAGKWALKEYPEWSGLVNLAIDSHGSSDKADSFDTQNETKRFVDFAISQGR
jgi:predicted nucleotidyltransferase